MPSAFPAHVSPPTEASATQFATLRWAELAELLNRASRVLGGDLAQQTATRGLSDAQFSLLFACGRGPRGGQSQSELAALLHVSPAHVSGLVEQMRGQGWLAGERRAPDRRKQVWQLTAQGDAQLAELIEGLASWAARLQQQMGSERCAALSQLLAELIAAVLQEASTNLSLFAPSAATPIQEGARS